MLALNLTNTSHACNFRSAHRYVSALSIPLTIFVILQRTCCQKAQCQRQSFLNGYSWSQICITVLQSVIYSRHKIFKQMFRYTKEVCETSTISVVQLFNEITIGPLPVMICDPLTAPRPTLTLTSVTPFAKKT